LEGSSVKFTALLLVAAAAAAGVVASTVLSSGPAEEEATSIFVTQIPRGYRDWRLISVAHEAGNLNDIRAILGNDAAIKAYRKGKLPFPDGAIIARIAWSYVPSEENDKVFGHPQSFVPGSVPSVYGQGLKEIRHDGRLGVRSIQ
jgi:Cytochrome P460